MLILVIICKFCNGRENGGGLLTTKANPNGLASVV